MDIEIANVDKLKVAELRALLSSHELDTKGTKPILVARLTSYLESLPPKDPNAPVVEAAAVAAAPEADGKIYSSGFPRRPQKLTTSSPSI